MQYAFFRFFSTCLLLLLLLSSSWAQGWRDHSVTCDGLLPVYANALADVTAIRSEKLDLALRFAGFCHKEQQRKSSKQPYIVHPITVARRLIEDFGQDEDVLVAALLHDTIEDCDYAKANEAEMRQVFGKRVVDLVQALSTPASLETEPDKSEKERLKREYLQKKLAEFAGNNPEALAIKLADRLDNVSDLGVGDAQKAYKRADETIFILQGLRGSSLSPAHKSLVTGILNQVDTFNVSAAIEERQVVSLREASEQLRRSLRL